VFDLQGGVLLGVQTINTLVKTADNPIITNTNEVATGATVNGIYLHLEAYATTAGALSNFYIAIAKNPGFNLTFPNANAIGADDNKKYVIHQEMVMLEKQVNGNPRTIFNGVIVIPKGYRRFGPGDRLVLLVLAPGVNADYCFQEHFKEFR